MQLLRETLLAGRRIALAGAVTDRLGEALRALGAELDTLPGAASPDEEERVGEWARDRLPLHALVYCAAADHRTDEIWAAVREVAVGALIPGAQGGKIVLIAPPRRDEEDAGRNTIMLRAELENLARTLSVEWARHGITAVAIAPGARTTSHQLVELVCFVVSEAGEYLSGCRLDLGSVA